MPLTHGGSQWSETVATGGARTAAMKFVEVAGSPGDFELAELTDPRPEAARLVSDGLGGYVLTPGATPAGPDGTALRVGAVGGDVIIY